MSKIEQQSENAQILQMQRSTKIAQKTSNECEVYTTITKLTGNKM